MTFKACRKINDSFLLDEKFDVFLVSRDITGDIKKRIPITTPMERGYVYACLFFFDEVSKELDKLRKMINKIIEEIKMDVHIEEPAKLLMELSARVRNKIGDDSLDAFIKEILAEQAKAIALMPTDKEQEKLLVIKDSILTELLEAFKEMTINKAVNVGGTYSFTFPKEYIEDLTPRQKKILSPALRLTNLYNQVRMEELKFMPNHEVQYKAVRLPDKFDAKEREIKTSLKTLMEKNFINEDVED